MPVLSEERRADFNQLELVMTKEFISQQLIHLIGCLDTNEEGGRYATAARYMISWTVVKAELFILGLCVS